MALRILDGGRPGLAILEFDRAMQSPEVDIAIRSMTSRPGLYLGADGAWEKNPVFFKAARHAGGGATTSYVVGRDVVNYVLDQDAIQISIAQTDQVYDTVWENATPEIGGQARVGRIYPGGRNRPQAAAVPLPPIAPEPEPAHEIQPTSPMLASEPAAPFPAEAPGRGRSWLGVTLGGLLLAGMLAATWLWLSPQTRCSWFGGALGGCTEEPSAILACIAEMKTGNACHAEQCMQVQSMDGWSPAVIEKVKSALADAKTQCVVEDSKTIDTAKACIEQKEAAGEFCQVRSCLAQSPVTAATGSPIALLETRVREDERRCTDERTKETAAADQARTCVSSKGTSADACDIVSTCYAPYLKEYPKGSASPEVTRLSEDARNKCRVETEAKEYGKLDECVNQQRRAGKICDVGSLCLDPYRRAHAGTPDAPQVAQAAQQAANECTAERARAEDERKRKEEERKRGEAQQATQQIDDQLWSVSRACAANSAVATGASGCNVRTCYQGYLAKFPSGRHVQEARAAIDAARCETPATTPPLPPPASLPNGTYNYRVSVGCGPNQPQQETLQATVQEGRVSWVHAPLDGPVQAWEGSLGNGDQLSATAKGLGHTANGTYNDVVMHYPNCDVSMRMTGRAR